MSRNFSRKDFLKLTAMAGAGIFIAGCAGDETKSGDDSLTSADSSKNAPKDIPEKISVDLIRKDDPRYEELRKGFNKRINKFPLVIALCTSTEDVSEAIQYARNNNLEIAIKSGGHSMEGFSCNQDGMVINVSKMNSVKIGEDETITTGPGCTLMHLYDEILPEKLILPTGSCGTVGLGGLTMGGGYGLFSREYGLTCDSLLKATMVDGNGKIHSTNDDPELLWALRGGGAGNFGVVTEMVFQSYPAPQQFQAYHFKSRKLDSEKAKSLLGKWFEFASQLPDSCFSGFVLNGKTLNVLVTNYQMKNNAALQPLLEEFKQQTDEFREGPVSDDVAKALKNYYGSVVPVYFKNSSAGLYKSFDEIELFIHEVLEKIVTTPGMIYQVNTLGGKIADPEFEKVSCYPHRAANFISELQAYWNEPSQETKYQDISLEILELFKMRGISNQYINYCSIDFTEWEAAYYGSNYPRLQAVKKKYDPENFIRHPQSVRV
ncbi:MAG: FAD-binding protein [Bacteroidota bacterium]|nr:FAD-binding protein [Bacteroidota bacterium]